MRVLITGGFGYLGGRIAQRLANQDYQVVLGSRKEQIVPEWLPEAGVIQLNWNDFFALKGACTNIDTVIHAAGMNAQDCENSPEQALEVNAVNTEKIVKAAMQQGVKQFIYLSTAHVYASPLVGYFDERSSTTNMHPYATSHLAGEEAVFNFSTETSMDVKILRISNAFGMPVDKNINCWMLLVNDLCRQVVTQGRIILNSNGTQQRNFITITELSCIIEKMIVDNSYGQREIINIGSNNSNTVYEMAEKVQSCCFELWGKHCPITRKKTSNAKTEKTLNYNSNYLYKNDCSFRGSFTKEIEKLLVFCKSNF